MTGVAAADRLSWACRDLVKEDLDVIEWPKRTLTAEQTHDLWVRMLPGQITAVQAEAGVDRRTLATSKRVAGDGTNAAFEASKPRRRKSTACENADLARLRGGVDRVSAVIVQRAIEPAGLREKLPDDERSGPRSCRGGRHRGVARAHGRRPPPPLLAGPDLLRGPPHAEPLTSGVCWRDPRGQRHFDDARVERAESVRGGSESDSTSRTAASVVERHACGALICQVSALPSDADVCHRRHQFGPAILIAAVTWPADVATPTSPNRRGDVRVVEVVVLPWLSWRYAATQGTPLPTIGAAAIIAEGNVPALLGHVEALGFELLAVMVAGRVTPDFHGGQGRDWSLRALGGRRTSGGP
jgi:hypothetical protein